MINIYCLLSKNCLGHQGSSRLSCSVNIALYRNNIWIKQIHNIKSHLLQILHQTWSTIDNYLVILVVFKIMSVLVARKLRIVAISVAMQIHLHMATLLAAQKGWVCCHPFIQTASRLYRKPSYFQRHHRSSCL